MTCHFLNQEDNRDWLQDEMCFGKNAELHTTFPNDGKNVAAEIEQSEGSGISQYVGN